MAFMTWYITLLLCGMFLIGAEIFVPGGVLGTAGAVALIAAAVIGFSIFPPFAGWLSLFLILFLAALAVVAWMKFFPSSPIGKSLTLAQNLARGSDTNASWKPGMQGVARSTLRPSGVAEFGTRRADVIARGTWIDANTLIQIVKVEGNRIYVDSIAEAGPQPNSK